tara:strand:+ start:414 stop:707 length:294 start_codon:yes stop_codon:yes gene_type:complete
MNEDNLSPTDYQCTVMHGSASTQSIRTLTERDVSSLDICQNLTEQFAKALNVDTVIGLASDQNGNVAQKTECEAESSFGIFSRDGGSACQTTMFAPK